MEAKLSQLNTSVNTTPEVDTSTDLSHLRLPLVTYSGGGQSISTEAGQEERDLLEEKLIAPYLDYNNEERINVIALSITIPNEAGQPYQVEALSATDEMNGREGFLFGARGEEMDYWKPSCMGPCEFSENFKKKYPLIVDQDTE